MVAASSTNMPSRWSVIGLPICLAWRIWLANRMPIMDCDEVFNYWEPLHNMLYGSGQQTWEYAHEYALRSYAYLVPILALTRFYQRILPFLPTSLVHAAMGLLVQVESSYATPATLTLDVTTFSPALILFVLLRCSLAAWMAYAEVNFCRALEDTQLVSPTVARWTLVVLQTSAGLAHAAGALLPSTTWTVAWLLAAACFVRGQPRGFVLYAVHASLVIGWPFGVLVLLPLGLYVLLVQTQPSAASDSVSSFTSGHLQAIKRLLMFTLVVTTIAQDTVMVIDHYYYGIWTVPSFNIFRYNAQGGGDEVYGIEPASYYIKNLLLNFNLVAVLGVLSMGSVAAAKLIRYSDNERLTMMAVLLSPLYVWFAVVVPRPHKEERFLFPSYPILCFGAVLALDIVHSGFWKVLGRISASIQPTSTHRSILHGVLWLPVAVVSMGRTVALQKYYAAPFSIYAALHSAAARTSTGSQAAAATQLVCTCGEWYRFPSSFTLPANLELAFLRSSFTGQLPQPFSKHGSLAASQEVLQPFNDLNQDEPTRYSEMKDCAFVIDLQESTDCQVPDSAQVIATAPFLDADKTTSTLHRTLYIPRLHEKAITEGTVHYQNYVLYKL